jgi:hypothetical protein
MSLRCYPVTLVGVASPDSLAVASLWQPLAATLFANPPLPGAVHKGLADNAHLGYTASQARSQGVPVSPNRHHQSAPTTAAWWIVFSLVVMVSVPALGLDYDRNDVVSREFSIGGLRVPMAEETVGYFGCGAIRRHNRFFYLGAEVLGGMTERASPLIGIALLTGVETASDGWTRLRGYGEVGIGPLYGGGPLNNILTFQFDAGARYLISSYRTPHIYLHLGIRAMTNLRHFGLAVHMGSGWSFD